MATELSKVARSIRAAQRIAIVAHISPDPDAIGSALGLMHSLAALGKQVVPLCDDGIPAELAFLPGIEQMQRKLPPDFEPEAVIALDASDTERLGANAALLEREGVLAVNIDHHVTNLNYGELNLVDTSAAATAELLVRVIDEVGAPLTPEAATCLMAGLVGDTRSFSIPGVTPATLRVAARLVEAGADLSDISERVMQRRTYGSLVLWNLGLSRMHLEDGVAWTSLPLAEREALNLLSIDGKGMSNLLLSIDEAYISAVFTERTDGRVDISFRAEPGFDVASLALALGGGGHPLAAGALVDGPLEEVVQSVVGRLKAQVAQQVRQRA